VKNDGGRGRMAYTHRCIDDVDILDGWEFMGSSLIRDTFRTSTGLAFISLFS
jgi:hypothetical protein